MPAGHFVATLRVSGLGARLADFRERVRYLMVREIEIGASRELLLAIACRRMEQR